jgi:glycosyltransferase involved in cell wall biosynthesis
LTAISEIMLRAGNSGERPDCSGFAGLRVILVGPDAPPVGGMTVQAGLLATGLRLEGANVTRVVTNAPLPGRLQHVPYVRGGLRLLKFRAALRSAIADRQDVIHIQSASWQYFWRVTRFALQEARDADIRTVVRWDGGEADRFFAQTPDEIGRVLVHADEIVVPSDFLRDVFRNRLGLDARVIPNLVEDPGVDRPPPRSAGRLRLLCARHLDAVYGVHVVIAAAALAVQRGVDLEIVIAGDGAERKQLEKAAARDLPGRAKFLGAVPRERVLDVLRETDVVINGSFFDNFPVAIAEALAAGVPVATTAAGGIPCIVEDGATGLVTPVGDANALASSLVRFNGDRAALADFGWKAKVHALRWTWEAVRADWAAAYGVASPRA